MGMLVSRGQWRALRGEMGMVVLCRVSLEERQVLAVNPAAIDGPSGQVLEV